MRQPNRARVAVLLATAAMVALGVAFVWLHIASPSDGARIDPNQQPWRANGVAVTRLARSASRTALWRYRRCG